MNNSMMEYAIQHKINENAIKLMKYNIEKREAITNKAISKFINATKEGYKNSNVYKDGPKHVDKNNRIYHRALEEVIMACAELRLVELQVMNDGLLTPEIRIGYIREMILDSNDRQNLSIIIGKDEDVLSKTTSNFDSEYVEVFNLSLLDLYLYYKKILKNYDDVIQTMLLYKSTKQLKRHEAKYY